MLVIDVQYFSTNTTVNLQHYYDQSWLQVLKVSQSDVQYFIIINMVTFF